MTSRTRLGVTYVYYPAPIDRLDRDRRFRMADGTLVRTVQPHGCPPNNTMRHSYIERCVDKAFYGLVANGSLYTLRQWQQLRKNDPALPVPVAMGREGVV